MKKKVYWRLVAISRRADSSSFLTSLVFSSYYKAKQFVDNNNIKYYIISDEDFDDDLILK